MALTMLKTLPARASAASYSSRRSPSASSSPVSLMCGTRASSQPRGRPRRFPSARRLANGVGSGHNVVRPATASRGMRVSATASAQGTVTAIRGGLLYFKDDPFFVDASDAFVYEADGLVVCRDGKIEAVGAYSELKGSVPEGVSV